MMDKCRVSGKDMYPDKRTARLGTSNGRSFVRQVYRCPFCWTWHGTRPRDQHKTNIRNRRGDRKR